MALRRAGDQPRRHRPHPRRRRRRGSRSSTACLALNGVAALDDSRTLLLEDDGWIAPAPTAATDLYVFAYGRDYQAALEAFYAVSGPTPRAAALRARQLVEPLPPLHRRRVRRADRPVPRRAPAVLGRGDRHGLAPGRHRPEATAAAGPATPGTPSCSPTRSSSSPSCTTAASRTSLNVHPAEGVHAHEDGVRRDGASAWASTPPPTMPVALRPHRPGVPRGLPRGPAPPARGRGRRLLVARLAAGRRHPHARASTRCGCSTTSTTSTPAATADRPLTFSRYAGHRQPPLPDRLLRRHAHHLGVAGLPAVLHRDRVERRLRLVEPRHRRPLQGLPRRRARHPVGAARRLLADHAAALRRSTRSTPRSRGGSRARPSRDERLPAAAAPAAALPAHDEPPRARRGRAARAADVLRPPRGARAPTTCRNQFMFGTELLVAPITTPRDR